MKKIEKFLIYYFISNILIIYFKFTYQEKFKMSTPIKLTILSLDGRTFELSPQESIQLELKLNVTKHGKQWKHIGDVLFEFNSAYDSRTFPVAPNQYDFLEMIHTTKKSWEECKNLE
jgi:hypothetical protein